MVAVLAAHHLASLTAGSSIPDRAVAARGYRTIEDPAELERLGFTEAQRTGPGLLIPVWGVDGEVVTHQFRPDHPRCNESGKTIKYETPTGSAMRLDVHPVHRALLGDIQRPLLITEGIKKADSATGRGLVTIGLIGVWNWRGRSELGGVMELADWDRIAIKGRLIYLAFDSDVVDKAPVRLALKRLAAMLKRRGASRVEVLRIPHAPDGAKVGLDDWFASAPRGRGVQELFALADPSIVDIETIRVNRGLDEVCQDAYRLILAGNAPPTTFVRAGEIVRVVRDEHGVPRIESFGTTSLRGLLEQQATWVKTNKDGDSSVVYLPKDIPELILAQGQWPELPAITAITRAPVVGRAGKVSTSPGYDPETTFYVDSREEWPIWHGTVPEAVSFILDEILGDFPFSDQADRANALALAILPIVRPIIDGPTPLHVIDAPVQGTGKSLLARILLRMTMGAAITATPGGKDEEEWRKKLMSGLLQGRAYQFFDNLSRKVDSDALAGVLTATEWADRALGSMTMISLPVRCAWVATANNVELSRDIVRRSVQIRLDSRVERPEDRAGSFRIENIEEYVIEHRRRIVAALVAIVENGFKNGRLGVYSGYVMGSYESWSRTVGAVLEAAGVDGFLVNVGRLRASADAIEGSWGGFYRRWHDRYGSQAVKAGDLVEIFAEDESLAGLLGDRGETSRKTRLGHLVKRRIHVISGGMMVETAGSHQGTQRYQIVFAEPVSPKPHQTPQVQNDQTPPKPHRTCVEPDPTTPGGVGGVFSTPHARAYDARGHAPAHTREEAEQNPTNPTNPTGQDQNAGGVCSNLPETPPKTPPEPIDLILDPEEDIQP